MHAQGDGGANSPAAAPAPAPAAAASLSGTGVPGVTPAPAAASSRVSENTAGLGELLSGTCIAALLLLYCFVTDAFLLLYCCFTAALLMLYCCFTASLLMLYASLLVLGGLLSGFLDFIGNRFDPRVTGISIGIGSHAASSSSSHSGIHIRQHAAAYVRGRPLPPTYADKY
jgi:hypothetical protein